MSFLETISSVFLLLISIVYLPVYFITHLLIQFLYLPRVLHRYIFHPSNVLQRRYFTKGGYALVTGATDGSGKGFAEELARRGWNVILHGRNPAKLSPIIEQLSALYPEQEFLPFLLDCNTPDLYTELPRHLQSFKHLDIRVLINNAGNLHSCVQFQDLPLHESNATINTNLIFPTVLTWCLLNFKNLSVSESNGPTIITPQSPKPAGVGVSTVDDESTYAAWRDPSRSPLRLVMNISSVASFFALHRGVPYSPTKAYLNTFSSFLRYTLAEEGIEVMNIPTGAMNTKMWPGLRGFWMVLEQNDFAHRALNKVGLARLGHGWQWWGWRAMGLGVDEPVPGGHGVWVYWWHQIMTFGQPLFPADVWNPIGDWACQLLGYKPKPETSRV